MRVSLNLSYAKDKSRTVQFHQSFRNHRRNIHGSPKRGEAPEVAKKRQKQSKNKITGSLNGQSFSGTINADENSTEQAPVANIKSAKKNILTPEVKNIVKSFLDREAQENSASESSDDEAAQEDDFSRQFVQK